MECKECGTNLKENALFCGVCGTKVEQLLNACGKCGGEVSEGAKFCRHCGEVMGEKKVEAQVVGETAVTVEPVSAPVEQLTPPPTPKKGLSKKNQKIIMGVAALVVVIIAISQLVSMPKASSGNNLDLVFFKNYDSDIYAKSSGKKEYILKDTDIDQILVSKDGKKIYYLDEDENLYLQEGKKAPEKISSDVSWAMISASGNTVAFMKDQDGYYGNGSLYVKSGKSSPEKASSEDCAPSTVSISENGKYVAFTEVEGDFYDEDGIRNYLYPVGGEKIKGGKQISLGVDNKGTILAYNSNEDLYIMKKGKDPDKITSEVESVIANKDFSKLLVLDQSGNLYACNGNEKERVESDVDDFYNIKGLVRYHGGMFGQTDTDKLDIAYSKNGRIYIKFDGKESERITNDYLSNIRISEDFKDVVYINDGGLYLKRFNNGKIKVDEKIDTRVMGVEMDLTGSYIAYKKDGDLYYLPKGKKEGIKVDTKDEVREIAIKKDGSIYYETRDGDLFLTKGKSTGKRIIKDVSEWHITDKAAYILDYDDTLFEVVGKAKPKKINNDVKELIKPTPNSYTTSYY